LFLAGRVGRESWSCPDPARAVADPLPFEAGGRKPGEAGRAGLDCRIRQEGAHKALATLPKARAMRLVLDQKRERVRERLMRQLRVRWWGDRVELARKDQRGKRGVDSLILARRSRRHGEVLAVVQVVESCRPCAD